MFIGREKELQTIQQQLENPKRSALLVYGKRRVGKSFLISQAAKSFQGIVIDHLCIRSTFEGNLELLSRSISQALDLPALRFEHLYDAFDFLAAQNKPILIVVDEYQYLKQSRKDSEVDSLMQAIIDKLPPQVKLVLCGSYITIMKELLEEANPLFGRFTAIIHLEEFDYLDAARFCPSLKPYDKIAFYAVFGGSPFVLSGLDYSKPLKRNIIEQLLPATSVLRTHIENVMLRELQQTFDVRILESLGNGKKRYSEIRASLGGQDTGLLSKQLSSLVNMETVGKTFPINKAADTKKHFYEIRDHLMRFYFAYLFGNQAALSRLGEAAFYEGYIRSSLTQFISRRLEQIALQYFARLAQAGELPGALNFGSYWYDNPATQTNGEFDCVVQQKDCLCFYECKYLKKPLKLSECKKEERQIRQIPGASIGEIGFICPSGFNFETSDYRLISGEDLYHEG